jgi:hypothetical protein
LDEDAPTLLARALQNARLYTDSSNLIIDLNALLKDDSDEFRPLISWARNTLDGNPPDGVIHVEPVVVRNLALLIGRTHKELANYLARFLPEERLSDDKEPSPPTQPQLDE